MTRSQPTVHTRQSNLASVDQPTVPLPVTPLSRVDPFSTTALEDPYPTYAHLRELGPAVWLDRYDLWAVTGYTAAEHVLTHAEDFTSTEGVGVGERMPERMGPGEIILHSTPPRHTVLHDILMRHLGRSGLRRWQPRIDAGASDLVSALVAASRQTARHARYDTGVDVVPVARRLAVTLAADLAGLPAEGRNRLAEWSRAAFTAFGPNTGSHGRERDAGLTALGEMGAYLASVVRTGAVAQHSAGADILAAAAADQLDPPTTIQLFAALVTAGIDTSSTAISNLIGLLASHPGTWQRLRAGTVTVTDAVAEALRFESPIRCFARTATVDAALGAPSGRQVLVREGERVLVFFGAANRDPDRWPDPDRFEPSRFRLPHLAFGRGMHACTGQALATAHLHAVTRALLAHVDELALVPHQTVPLRHPVINGFARLVVALRPTRRPGRA